MNRDWQKDNRYLQELSEWELDPDDEDLYKIATHWHQHYAEVRDDAVLLREQLAKINCDYYADKQRFVVQRRELADLEAREQKLREAMEETINEALTLEDAIIFLNDVLASLYPKEETK